MLVEHMRARPTPVRVASLVYHFDEPELRVAKEDSLWKIQMHSLSQND